MILFQYQSTEKSRKLGHVLEKKNRVVSPKRKKGAFFYAALILMHEMSKIGSENVIASQIFKVL